MERTFHHDRSPLHGLTVAVETPDELWVGRCDDEDDDRVILLDADVHRPGDGVPPRDEWLGRALEYGVWPRHRRVVLPRRRVRSLRRLSELGVGTEPAEAPPA
ncbi:MAG: hypothetical protein ACLF0P_09115 [Thermoanaerobaculia bacterium]